MSSDIEAMFKDLEDCYPGSKTKRKPPEERVGKTRHVADNDWDSRPFVKYINNKPREMFTLGALAAALGRPIVTVRLWTRKGYIPQAPYRLPTQTLDDGRKLKGRRLYTRALIEATIDAFVERNLIGVARVEWSDHKELSIHLLETWQRIYAQESGH